jgi:hypothetical protein
MVAIVAVAGLGVAVPSAGAAEAPSASSAPRIAVEPRHGLVPDADVTVSGTGWTSALVGIVTCRTAVYGAAPPAGDARWNYLLANCTGLAIFSPDGEGAFSVLYTVHRDEAGCGAAPGDCVVYALGENFSHVFSRNAVPITFDTAPPTCQVTRHTNTGLDVTVRDAGSGLATVEVTTAANAHVTVPPFTVGTKRSIVVHATKEQATQPSQVALRVTDLAGNVTNCDPILTTLIRERRPQVFYDVPGAEHLVTITNGDPGLRTVLVTVHRDRYRRKLAPGQSTTIDIGPSVQPTGSYTVKLRGRGKGSADIMIWDGN